MCQRRDDWVLFVETLGDGILQAPSLMGLVIDVQVDIGAPVQRRTQCSDEAERVVRIIDGAQDRQCVTDLLCVVDQRSCGQPRWNFAPRQRITQKRQ